MLRRAIATVVIIAVVLAACSEPPVTPGPTAPPTTTVARDTLQRWSRLSKENWVKDLGHDRGTTIGCYKLYLLKELKND